MKSSFIELVGYIIYFILIDSINPKFVLRLRLILLVKNSNKAFFSFCSWFINCSLNLLIAILSNNGGNILEKSFPWYLSNSLLPLIIKK